MSTADFGLSRETYAPRLTGDGITVRLCQWGDQGEVAGGFWDAAGYRPDEEIGHAAGDPRVERVPVEGELTYANMGMYILAMARAATTSDVFNAVAEPRRREVIELLAGGERSVGELVSELGTTQPQVSKHLRVLLEVELVSVRREGRHRLYHLEGEGLKQIHDWAKRFEPLWQERFDLRSPTGRLRRLVLTMPVQGGRESALIHGNRSAIEVNSADRRGGENPD